MKRLIILLLILLCISLGSFSQDPWKKMVIDENLTISFPHSVIETDTTVINNGEKYGFKTFTCEGDSSTLVLIITPGGTDIKVNNEESWKSALDGLAKGATNSFLKSGITCTTSDTTMDDLPCKKLTCQTFMYSMLNNYIFLVNDKMYSIQAAYAYGFEPEAANTELRQFLNSIHFSKESIKEREFGSKAESTGYAIGKLILPLLLIIGVIVFVVKKT